MHQKWNSVFEIRERRKGRNKTNRMRNKVHVNTEREKPTHFAYERTNSIYFLV